LGFLALVATAVAQSIAPSPPAETALKLSEVVVTPSRFGVADERLDVGATLTAAELESLPQIGDDLYRSIARLPGLAANDFTAAFWVRGAPNREVLARLDGVELIEPFHLKDVDGALSIVDPATIRRLDIVTGGFTTDFGDRLAGVLTLETKSPAQPRTALELSLTGIGGNHTGTFARGAGRWSVAARRGYPDIALRVSHRDDEVSPRYYDATAKVEYQLTPEHAVSFHVLHAGDTLRYERKNNPTLTSGYDSDYVWGRWLGSFGARVKGEAVLSYARLAWNRDGSGTLDGFPFALRDHRQLEIFGLRQEWNVSVNERVLLRGGLDVRRNSSDYDYALSHAHSDVSAGRQITVTDNVTARLAPDGDTAGAFASARFRPISNLVIEPGVRYDRNDVTHDANASPRLNASLTTGRATWRAAWGAFRQSQGLHELAVADRDTAFHRAELAEHRVIGFERPLVAGVGLRVEAYERITTRLRPQWENLDNPYDLFPEAQSDRVRVDANRARARGIEMLLNGRASPRVTWNVSYALARTEELVAGKWVPRARDQRHTFYADVTFTPTVRWELSAAWQYHTGWPTTDVVYTLAPLTNGRRLLVSANGPIYDLRLPDYHRLDLRATRRFHTKRGEVRAFLDVFNAYDRTNLVGYDHSLTIAGATLTDVRKPREQLPFLPSAGVSWEF
jgi:outer membrane cobalamin receptor